ncbi:MAG: lipid IV(A) palmitoyltransferase PagP [Legionellaceae bacterium]|nr:lipid IV(A) palmitoyltransferase PagP [Legionellaceae bacterium]
MQPVIKNLSLTSLIKFLFLGIVVVQSFAAEPSSPHKPNLLQEIKQTLHDIWFEGKNELYLSGYAWHNRYTYDEDRLKTYNENAWGGGLGKAIYTENGHWHALYAMVFRDSHCYPQTFAGYAFLKTTAPERPFRIGGGYTIAITQRPDVANGIPFPGILPAASIQYRKAAIMAAYVPGKHNVGNVLFVFLKWTL